jgi:fibronectin type 3 domain-containing protein
MALMIATVLASGLTGCLGGSGGGDASSQSSAASAEFVSSTVVDYDTVTATLSLKGKLNVPGGTDFNIVNFHTDSACATATIGHGLKQDFSETGIQIQIPSTAISPIYISTNTTSSCLFLFEFLPRYDAPSVPVLRITSPTSPTRVTASPRVIGSTSLATKVVRLYSDSACSTLVASGTATDFQTTGLLATLIPNAITEIYATAADAFGKTSACTKIGEFEHSSTGPSVPTFVSMDPVSPTNRSLTPKIIGAVGIDSATVTVYKDAACSTAVATGTADEFRTTGFQLTSNDNTSTTFYGQSVSSAGLASDCAFLTIYVHDSLAAAPPVFVSVSPTSPTRLTLYPRIKGTAPTDALNVKLFDDAMCTNMVGSGTKSVFESAGIATTVRANDMTIIYAETVDAAGNLSACTEMTTFIHDTIAPEVPSFTETLPASPNNQSVTPRVLGNLDVTATEVRLFDDGQCAHSIGSGTSDEFSTTGVLISVTGNQTTTIYSQALDEAQNASDCSALTNYAHSTAPAPNPGFYQSIPASPSRVSNRPWIVGTASNQISRVTIYRDNLCATAVGNATRSAFTTSGIQVTLPLNTVSNLYAVSQDVYGNLSSCTLLTTYTHDSVAPRDPIFDYFTPASPNNTSTTPIIYGSISVDPAKVLPVTTVGIYDSFLCLNQIGSGTLATGLTAAVPPNSLTTLYARSFDAAGNFSGCVYFTDYIHDALIPGRPQLLSVTPTNPSYSAITKMFGRIGTTTDFLAPTAINVYSDSNCTNIMTSWSPTTFTTAGGAPLVVNRNATTTVYATTVNIVGTASPCTSLINYVHRDNGPANVTANQNLDGSVSIGWLTDVLANPSATYTVRRSLVSGGPYTTIAQNVFGTSYIDFSISNGATYFYVIAASNTTGQSKNSAEASITINVPTPNAVAGLSALPGPNQVTLNWSGFNTDMSFKVFRSTQPGGPYAVVATKLKSSTYIDSGLTNGVPYYYVVLGTNPKGDSLHSNEASAKPISVPSAPTSLTLSTVLSTPACSGGPGVILKWSPSPYYNVFKIYRGLNPGTSGLLATSAVGSYVDCNPGTDAANGINYNYYAVTAGWGIIESAKSNVVVFARETSPLLSVYPGDSQVLLRWTADPRSIGYRVERASRSKGPYTVLAANNAANTFTDSSVTNNQSYFYVVTALYPAAGSYGWQSLEQSGTPGINPGAPVNLLLNVDSNKMPRLTWVPPDAFNYFNVYRGPSAGGPFTFIGTSKTPDFTDASPDLGMNFYNVTATWGTYESASTGNVAFRFGTPISISATPSATTITVAWSAVPGVLDYGVYRGTKKGGPYTLQTTTTSLSYVDSTVISSEGYFYVVRANFADGTSGQDTSEVDATLTSANVPAGLAISDRSASSLTLTWSKIKGAGSYKVYRATSVGGPYALEATVTSTSAIVSPLNSDTEYFLKVRYVKSGSTSSDSAIVSGFTLDVPSAPIGSPGLSSISLNWGDLNGVIDYDLRRSTDGITFSTLTTGLTSAAYIDSAVTAGQQYFYTVVANYANGSFESPASLGITPGITARVPEGLTVTDNSTGTDIELAWSSISGTTSYRVYSATTSGGPYTVAMQTSSTTNNIVTGLTAGIPHYFVVSSLVGSVESATSAEVSVVPMLSPPAPTAAASGPTISLSWSAVSGAATYDIYRSLDNVLYTSVGTSGAATSYTDSTVSSAVGYTYKYYPKDAAGISMASSLASAIVTPGTSPNIPTTLNAQSASTTSVTLRWVQVPNASAYNLYRAGNAGGPYTSVSTISSPTTSFLDSSLTPGQTYFYVLRSTNTSSVESADSNEVSVTLVPQPTGLIAVAAPNQINLSWPPVAGASSYTVRRSESSGGPYGTVSANQVATSFTDPNTRHGVTYFYVITGSISGNTSPDSNEASATAFSAMNLEVAIELTDQGLGSDVAPNTFARTRTSLNTTDYDGTVTYSFEIVATNSDAVPRTVDLVDATGATVGSVAVPATTVLPTRIRSSAVPTAGANNYRIKTAATTNSSSLQVYSARIMVHQINASRTKLYIPLMASAAGIYTGDIGAYIETTSNQTYQELASASIFRRNTAALATIPDQNAWQLETVVGVAGTARGSLGLYNTTRNSIVNGTESTFESAGPTLNLSPFSEGELDFGSANEGDLYQIVLRCDTITDGDCDTGSARLYKAGLWVTLTSVSKAETVYRTSLALTATSETLPTSERTMIDLSKFSNPMSYFQATGNATVMMDSGTIDLVSLGTTDSGSSSPTAIPGTSLIFSSTAKSYQRTPASITLNSGDRHIPRITPGTDPFRFYDASIVVQSQR